MKKIILGLFLVCRTTMARELAQSTANKLEKPK